MSPWYICAHHGIHAFAPWAATLVCADDFSDHGLQVKPALWHVERCLVDLLRTLELCVSVISTCPLDRPRIYFKALDCGLLHLLCARHPYLLEALVHVALNCSLKDLRID